MSRARLVCALCVAGALTGACSRDQASGDRASGDPPSATLPSNQPSPTGKVELVKAPAHVPVDVILKRELAAASESGRDVIVYVGAPWCEPCRYFHDAAARGELDTVFPRLRVIEFNLDEDEARLTAAGCRSRMIPLFALPTPDGRCDAEKRMMGSIKGPGAVTNIAPRLAEVLSQR